MERFVDARLDLALERFLDARLDLALERFEDLDLERFVDCLGLRLGGVDSEVEVSLSDAVKVFWVVSFSVFDSKSDSSSEPKSSCRLTDLTELSA